MSTVRHKNREFMFDFVLNFQKMTNVSMNDKIENDDFDNDNEKKNAVHN